MLCSCAERGFENAYAPWRRGWMEDIMYTLSVPVINKHVNDSNRHLFLSQLKRAEADRVLLSVMSIDENIDDIKRNVEFFRENGIEPAIWIGSTIGHGGPLLHEDVSEAEKERLKGIQKLVNLDGDPFGDTHCPLDEDFQRIWGEFIAKCAATGAAFVLLDDDYRLSQHGASFCCACDKHMAKIREYCGEDISRSELKSLAFSGKPNKYRAAWLRAEGESLEILARAFRAETDKLALGVPLAVCSCYSTWGLDGADIEKITDILAGKNKKFLRTHGAPYWTYNSNISLPDVIEISRMMGSFIEGKDIEIVSEGDAYPRPRTNCPASYLELFDAALRADGSHGGILKYMMEYNAYPMNETGYIDRHRRDMTNLKHIEKIFDGGANYGVRVLIKPHLLDGADLSLEGVSQMEPWPKAGTLLVNSSIPTVYRGRGICTALFGENARHFSPEEMGGGVIIDSVAAIILQERGIDVGVKKFLGTKNFNELSLTDAESGIEESSLHSAGTWVMRVELDPSAEILTYLKDGGDKLPFAYNYENADGVRFTVFLYCGKATSANCRFTTSYTVRSALERAVPYLAREPLAYKVKKSPSLYTLCRKTEREASILLCNCFADSLIGERIELDREYSQAEFIGACGHLEGKTIVFDSEVAAYDFAAVRVYE